MSMPLVKAKEIMKSYKEHNYKASKALPPLGYSGNNVRANSGEILDTATRAIVASGDNDAILEYLNITDKDIAREYLYIVDQRKDMSSKLKALQPLLARKGIKWNDDKQTIVPMVNITMKDNTAQQREVILPTTNIVGNIDNTAQLSDTNTIDKSIEVLSNANEGAGVDSPATTLKEEDCPPLKISEKVTIDNSEEMSSDDIPSSFTE